MPWNDYGQYLRGRHGFTVYRIPIDLDLGCPHRDADGRGGCLFCAEDGARARHLQSRQTLASQVSEGVALVRERYGAEFFMAYFQAYTSTNAPVARLRKLFAEALAQADFPLVTVSTRPDCLPPEVLDLLEELASGRELWVELGVQSANDETLRRIHRGHDFACTVQAVQRLADRGLKAAAHLILGLPGEGREETRRTAAAVAALPFSAVKLHQLQVLKGSGLENPWRRGEIPTLDEHAYAEELMDFLRRIPAGWPVMRLVAENDPQAVLAPRWWLGKGEFLRYLERQFRQRGWRQGDLCGEALAQPGLSQDPVVEIPVSPGPVRGLAIVPEGKIDPPASLFPPLASSEMLALGGDVRRLTHPPPWPVLWGDPRFQWSSWPEARTVKQVWVAPTKIEACPEVFSLDFWRRLLPRLSADVVVVSSCTEAPFAGLWLKLGFQLGFQFESGREFLVAARSLPARTSPWLEKRQRIVRETIAGLPYRDPGFAWTRKRILQHRQQFLARLGRYGCQRQLQDCP